MWLFNVACDEGMIGGGGSGLSKELSRDLSVRRKENYENIRIVLLLGDKD
jgi:hypothetical protein